MIKEKIVKSTMLIVALIITAFFLTDVCNMLNEGDFRIPVTLWYIMDVVIVIVLLLGFFLL